MDYNEKYLIKEIERLKTKIKNKTAYTKSLEKKAYDLSVANGFFENRIAIAKSKKQDFIKQTKHLTKEERAELLQRIRDFKSSIHSFIEESKKKDVELVKGKIYVSDVKTNDNNQSVNLVFRYLKESQKDHPYKRIATDSEKIRYVEWEEKNGKFWNDEKQDFLKLEDVRCSWSCMQDLSEILPFVDKFSSEEDSFDDTWANSLYFNEKGLSSSQFITGRIKVTKEVFIKLLKNYKG